MSIRELTQKITEILQPLYDPHEAAAVASWYVCARLKMERYELALRGHEEVEKAMAAVIEQEVERLKSGCPLQYVLGETEFYGLPFRVSPAVLIPRPETEELVMKVVDDARTALNPERLPSKSLFIWDVGTGSGCIAVSLAKMLPDAKVFATDISEEALSQARQNAELNGVGVTFARHDMADVETLPFGEMRFEVIISNPPYIPASDRAMMHKNVVDFEPETALFVPDDDKLWCYRALARLAQRTLAPDGRIYVETYHDFHDELAALFHQHGFNDVQSVRDLNGKLRFMVIKN